MEGFFSVDYQVFDWMIVVAAICLTLSFILTWLEEGGRAPVVLTFVGWFLFVISFLWLTP